MGDEVQPETQPENQPEILVLGPHELICQTKSGHSVPDGCTYGEPLKAGEEQAQ